jgi:sterol desaturase/sphingolipid hydroxylase (fatty acid hydroxylase superfamily)
MSDVRTFLFLLVGVQSFFFLTDAYEHWRLAARPNGRGLLKLYGGLSVYVLLASIGYLALQLALAAIVPDVRGVLQSMPEKATNPAPLTTVIAVFLCAFWTVTLFDYLVHRFLLHGILWRLHENHHVPAVVSNLMPGIAVRPFVAIPNLLINVGSCLAIYGVGRLFKSDAFLREFVSLTPPLIITFAIVACSSHSNFLRRFELVDRLFKRLLLVSPREHALHHTPEIPGNYGNFTVLWDRLFGSYVSVRSCADPVFGLAYDQDFLGALTAGRITLTSRLRQRLRADLVNHINQSKPTRTRE